MSLTLRQTKGSKLTIQEMDGNLTYLEGLTGPSTLEETLATSNVSGTYSIVMGTNTKINSASGNGQLDLRYGGSDSEVMLSTDGGTFTQDYYFASPGYTEINSSGQLQIFGDNYNAGFSIKTGGTNDIDIYGTGGFSFKNNKLVTGPGAQDAEMILDHSTKISIGESVSDIQIGWTPTTTKIGLKALTVNSDGSSEFGGIVQFAGVVQFAEYTVATLPTASNYSGGQIMVTDEVGGYTPAFSDGTKWRRMRDSVIVS